MESYVKDTNVTSAKIVWPFYAYAAVAFLCSCILLFYKSNLLLGHYFQPSLLAITHTMAIAWATMVIIGATLQLLPVLTNQQIENPKLARYCFYLAGLSIPFLIHGFYYFVFGLLFFCSASILMLALFLFVWIIYSSSKNSTSIQVEFMLSASIYLTLTVLLGFTLALNFSYTILPVNSLVYLKLHAHLGIIGWFLFLIIGVGSKLIPMFFISKYSNEKLLRYIYYFLHASMLLFIVSQTFYKNRYLEYLSISGFIAVIGMFLYFIYFAFKYRIKKKLDWAMKAAPFSKLMLAIAVSIVLFSLIKSSDSAMLSYGFIVFFGWISLLILGMTFKTLPFIIWNYKYAEVSSKVKNPKDLYSEMILKIMLIVYILGITLTLLGMYFSSEIILLLSTGLMSVASLLYVINVFKILFIKPTIC